MTTAIWCLLAMLTAVADAEHLRVATPAEGGGLVLARSACTIDTERHRRLVPRLLVDLPAHRCATRLLHVVL